MTQSQSQVGRHQLIRIVCHHQRYQLTDQIVEVVERVFPSPFDYRRQAVLVLEHDPERPYDGDATSVRHVERLCRLVAVTGGRLLALFTNRRQMEAEPESG